MKQKNERITKWHWLLFLAMLLFIGYAETLFELIF